MPAPTRILATPRLDLVAATPAHLGAELDDPARLAGLLGAHVPPGWPPGEYDRGAMEYFRNRLREGGEEAVGWYAWYAIVRRDAGTRPTLIGACGYVGPPDEGGSVEVGYSIVAEWQGRGYGTEMVAALIARAWAVPSVRRIAAQTAPGNTTSVALLRRLGFKEAGAGSEPGTVRFVLERRPS